MSVELDEESARNVQLSAWLDDKRLITNAGELTYRDILSTVFRVQKDTNRHGKVITYLFGPSSVNVFNLLTSFNSDFWVFYSDLPNDLRYYCVKAIENALNWLTDKRLLVATTFTRETEDPFGRGRESTEYSVSPIGLAFVDYRDNDEKLIDSIIE